MKHFKTDRSDHGKNPSALYLEDQEGYHCVVSFEKQDEDKILVMEECDYFFGKSFTKQEFLEMLDELSNWVNNEVQ